MRLRNERGGADTLLITLFVFPLLLFASFGGVPFFVYLMKGTHLNVAANHALKEAETAGYVSPEVAERTAARLASLGLEPITLNGVTYPSFAGSTMQKVLRDDADAVVTVSLTYPAPNVTKLLGLVGSGGGGGETEGFYRIVLHGRSEAYE